MEVGDLVSCVVDRIVGTVVFVKIHGQKQETEGSIVFSEVAPGRIRNIRDYVVPKKKIVCKILRISNNNIDLSLRRVTQKERKEVLEGENLEKSYISILKSVLENKAEETIREETKAIEALKEERVTREKKIEDQQERVDEITEQISAREEKIKEEKKSQIKPAEIRVSEREHNDFPGRAEVNKEMRDWERFTEREIEIVDTEEEWWKNNEETLVVQVELGDWESQKAEWELEVLGEKMRADEISTAIITSQGREQMVARFWWD